MRARYSFDQVSEGVFEIKEDGFFLLKFTRNKIRFELEQYALRYDRSSKWVGSMVRLFTEKYGIPDTHHSKNTLYDDLRTEEKYVALLRERGLRVFRPSPVPEKEMIVFLRGRGFTIEGSLEATQYMMSGSQFSLN